MTKTIKEPFIDLKPQYEALKIQIHERLHRVLEHGQFIMGPEVRELEEQLSQFLGGTQAVACSSGTDALLLALMALGIQKGDEVITTPFTFAATAEAVVLVGATPVFVDIDPDTYILDVQKVSQAINKKTKAILPVALFGQPALMDEFMALAEKHQLWVIEDAAQSFGAKYKNLRSGSLGHISCTSFFPAKPLGGYGDGGAVFTNNEELATRVRYLLNHGQTQRNHYEYIGINGRLDSLQAAVLLCKLERYEWELQQRQVIANNYTKGLKGLEVSAGWKLPRVTEGNQSTWAQYTVSVPQREALQKYLLEHHIPTAVYYPNILAEQPAYMNHCVSHSLDNAKKVCEEVLSLPFYPDMKQETQQRIIETLIQFSHTSIRR